LQKIASGGEIKRMTVDAGGPLPILKPNLQISFYYRLQTLREVYLHEALKKTVRDLDIVRLDRELGELVPREHLARVASFGLRGEIFFPVPYLMEANPFLLGYYRLLFGVSQKEFYKAPFGTYKVLEEEGTIPDRLKTKMLPLCKSLISTGQILVDGIDTLSLPIVQDLQILTVGAYLRGSENNTIGQGATKEVFDIIEEIIRPHLKEKTERTILVENEANEMVLIEFLSDPDVGVTKKVGATVEPLVSMEIKGGGDVSNIHNRIGEAEKSHNKARKRGFTRFWTILRANVDLDRARVESPTTSTFFFFNQLKDAESEQYKEFSRQLRELIGIRTVKPA
jgi:hypothetical protein